MRYAFAVYIVSGEDKSNKLFAVCVDGSEVTRHYNLAKASIEKYSSDWVTVRYWNKEFEDIDYVF